MNWKLRKHDGEKGQETKKPLSQNCTSKYRKSHEASKRKKVIGDFIFEYHLTPILYDIFISFEFKFHIFFKYLTRVRGGQSISVHWLICMSLCTSSLVHLA